MSKPGEPINIVKGNDTVSTSRNLRGVITYARKHAVRAWTMRMTDDYGASVGIWFDDGAQASFEFASWDVAQRWIRARRSWGLQGQSIRPTYEGWSS